ncbi:MAG: N-6 DNA methylase [Desulfobacterales bacterium]|nr:N-6 DNA methylase [Desulfobacterales bacterium]
MKYTTIRIEGAILSGDVLEKIDQAEVIGQNPKDFGFDASAKIKDEIARAWADAQDLWRIFQRRKVMIRDKDAGTSETRTYWILPLLDLLGYQLEYHKESTVINEKKYPISHTASRLDGFPIHVISFKDSLDKKSKDNGYTMSPHALIQEYLNLSEHLYGIVTNGIYLRLLRDSSRLIRFSYLEFDLESMMEDGHFTDFAILFRLLHSSRMPKQKDSGAESIIEHYHQDSLDSGSRIRNGLSDAVENSILLLANGFLNNPNNAALREKWLSNTLFATEYYHYLLKIIYRLLFLMVIEERNLIYPKKEEQDKTKQDIYYKYYSVKRLRKLCEKNYLENERYTDLWIGLKNTFALFESEIKGGQLDIKPLAGELFSYNAIGILNECHLDNKTLLDCIHNLNFFTNKTSGQRMRVNYASLNVEEFGSVYEGLLEYSPQIDAVDGKFKFSFVKGSDRSSTGSHYTPDELVSPLIKHSLDHIISRKLSEPDPEKGLLSIRVCDPASGSGHILLNAARRIGVELAKLRTKEDQPSPSAYREGVRDAIKHCIYGVDKNRLAVELCKVSLWLEAHVPGEPLHFLDHHIKCGDSIVGLAHQQELLNDIPNEAFKKLQGDDAAITKALAKRNKREISSKDQLRVSSVCEKSVNQHVSDIARLVTQFELMPEKTPQQVQNKEKAYRHLTSGTNWWRLKCLADLHVAQFFIPKTQETEAMLVTSETYQDYLSGIKPLQGKAIAHAMSMAATKHFFHWFLEFPEIALNGGFDCVLGNPPFLGGQKLSGTFGANFLEYVKYAYSPAGSCDIVTYFFRRIFTLLKPKGFQALIATNTIAQGAAREGGLDVILIKHDGSINFAIRSMKWPGLAAVEVSLISIFKGKWNPPCMLNHKPVSQITAYLDDSETLGKPYPLQQNADKSFQGSIVLGKGFILEPHEAQRLIEQNPKNKEVLFPYLNGEDLNTNPDQSPSRWVINFFDWTEEKCRKEYPECFEIVERLVKPERLINNDKVAREKWWLFLRMRHELYRTIAPLERVLVINRHSKITTFEYQPTNIIFSEATVVCAESSFSKFSLLNSSFHEIWSWKLSSTMGTGTLRYAPTDCFQTFPFPQNLAPETETALETIGSAYHDHRQQLMRNLHLGLTKTYNQFHNPRLAVVPSDVADNDIEKRYGKETLTLYKHLNRTENVCQMSEAVDGITKLRGLHKQMDEAVLKAYHWQDIPLAHDFYDVEYLPENDRIRYTISPEARKEILKRLLWLNHEIHHKEEPSTKKV